MVIADIEEATVGEEMNHNEVTLVLPSNGNAIRLREFTEKFNQIFDTRILKTTGSWTEISITLERNIAITTANMLDHLANMPEVEMAEEKQVKNHQANQEVILVKLATPKINSGTGV